MLDPLSADTQRTASPLFCALVVDKLTGFVHSSEWLKVLCVPRTEGYLFDFVIAYIRV